MIHFNTELGILILIVFAFIDFGLAAWNRQFRQALWRFGSRFVALVLCVASTMFVSPPMLACAVAAVAWLVIAWLPRHLKGTDHAQWFWRMIHGIVAIGFYAAMTAAR